VGDFTHYVGQHTQTVCQEMSGNNSKSDHLDDILAQSQCYSTLNQIGLIALSVTDVDRAETFYENVIGLRKLYRFGDLSFFDCAGVRLLLEKGRGQLQSTGLYLFPLRRHRIDGNYA